MDNHKCSSRLLDCLTGAFAAAALLHGCAASTASQPQALDLFDQARARQIPIIIYGAGSDPAPLAIISPGYGVGSDQYSFLANALVSRGFVVAAVQHDLPGDPAPATSGDIATLRRPIWLSGVNNLNYAIDALRAHGVANQTPVVLVGHSQGGDISMLFADLYPDRVGAVFSLDNRRMRMPRTGAVRLCSIRSNDFPADPDVVPDPDEHLALRLDIYPSEIGHDEMTDQANPSQRRTMLAALDQCLRHTR